MSNELECNTISPCKYYSQIEQDKYFIENINNGKRNGYFVDIGANDGITFSNTFTLEQSFGWKGLCVELDDLTFAKLQKNRTCNCVKECVFSTSGIEKEIEVPLNKEIPEGNNMLIRIKDLPLYDKGVYCYFNEQFQSVRTYKKITKTLSEIFSENSVPSVIDYMSIDIEGSDLDALKGLDFSKYKILFLTIEWGGGSKEYLTEITNFLHEKGYKQHRVNNWDVEFVPI